MAAEVRGAQQLRDLSLRLREMGKEGRGLRRELYRAMNDSVKPLMQQLHDAAYLDEYLPRRYAEVLASDLAVTAQKRGGQNASLSVRVRGRLHKRQVERLDAGILRHPVFGNREVWRANRGGVRPGFFVDAVRAEAPHIRDEVQAAMHEVARKITR